MWTLRLWVKRKMEMFHFNSFVTSITSSQGKFKNLKGHSSANLKWGGGDVGGPMHRVHHVYCFKLSLCCRSFFLLVWPKLTPSPYDIITPIYNTNNVCVGWQADVVQVSFPRPPGNCMCTNSLRPRCATVSLYNRYASAHTAQLSIQRPPKNWNIYKTRQSKQCRFSIYIFDNSKSKSMVRLEKMALSGLVFARKIARMILIQNI